MGTQHAPIVRTYSNADAIVSILIDARSGVLTALSKVDEFEVADDETGVIVGLRQLAYDLGWEIEQARERAGLTARGRAHLRAVE